MLRDHSGSTASASEHNHLHQRTRSIPYEDNEMKRPIWDTYTGRSRESRNLLISLVCFAALLFSGYYAYRGWSPGAQRSWRGGAAEVDWNAEKALVIASFTDQDVSWLREVPDDFVVYRYIMDDPNSPLGLSVPRNQGREAMAYLTYIVDNYDNLPPYIVFTHGHYRSWHQVQPLPWKLRALNITALEHEGFISLRCGDQMGCEKKPYIDTFRPNWGGETFMREFWHTIVPHQECPKYISYKCCTQQAVTRANIRKRSKRDWQRIRDPLMRDPDDIKQNEVWGRGPPVADEWIVGMFYEKFWHVLLGADPEFCPSIDYCEQVHFQNAIACDSSTDFTPFEGDSWKDVRCISAFEGLGKNERANVSAFAQEILGHHARIRGERWGRIEEERQRVRELEEELRRLQDRPRVRGRE